MNIKYSTALIGLILVAAKAPAVDQVVTVNGENYHVVSHGGNAEVSMVDTTANLTINESFNMRQAVVQSTGCKLEDKITVGNAKNIMARLECPNR